MNKLLVVPLLILFVGLSSCSDDDESPEAEVETKGEITSYKDVVLKLVDSGSQEYVIAFSTMTGKTYKQSEITVDNVAEIDFLSFTNQAFIAFNSPDEDSDIQELEGAKSTKIQMTEVAIQLTNLTLLMMTPCLKT